MSRPHITPVEAEEHAAGVCGKGCPCCAIEAEVDQ